VVSVLAVSRSRSLQRLASEWMFAEETYRLLKNRQQAQCILYVSALAMREDLVFDDRVLEYFLPLSCLPERYGVIFGTTRKVRARK